MKKAQYRIASRGTDHWPQVRFKGLFWGGWQKIGLHPGNSFGLYSESNRDYPNTSIRCHEIIKEFIIWRDIQNVQVTYKEIVPLADFLF